MSHSLQSGDRSFDGLAVKFDKNIYGTTKGKLRQAVLLKQLAPYIAAPKQIIDIGAGTGAMAQALLAEQQKGQLPLHQITLTDCSQEALTMAKAKLPKNAPVTFIHAALQALPTEGKYDLVLCHAVLEWLEAPFDALPGLIAQCRVGGHVSLSFFNQDAKRFTNLLYGNFDYVAEGMQKRNQVRLNPKQPLVPKAVLQALGELPVAIELTAGVRCFHDYLRNPEHGESKYQQLLEMELQYASQEPYLWLGKYFHIVMRRLA